MMRSTFRVARSASQLNRRAYRSASLPSSWIWSRTTLLRLGSRASSSFGERSRLIHTSALALNENTPKESSSPENGELLGGDQFRHLIYFGEMTERIDATESQLPAELLTPEARMSRIYANVYAIFAYLGRFPDEQEAAQYLVEFEQAAAPKDTEMYQARQAVMAIITSAIHQSERIPPSSPLRSHHSQIFDVLSALIPIHDVFIQGQIEPPNVPEWSTMWDRTQPILLTLAELIDGAGLGVKSGEP